MKETRKKVIRLFVVAVIVLNSITAVIDSSFELLLRRYEDYSTEFNLIGAANIIVSLIFFSLVTYFFVKRLNHIFNQEVDRQVQAHHLLYTSIAHDLRTPMSSIKGYMLALMDGKVEISKQRTVYQTINQKVDTINSLLTHLLEYSKLSRSAYVPIKETVNINELIRQSVVDQYDLIESVQAELAIELPDHSLEVEAVSQDLKRVIDNLLVNACKHNPCGSRIQVGCLAQNQGVEIWVADNGVKIDPGQADALFDPFYKLDEARSSGHGSGLGLAIVKMLLEKQAADIELVEGPAGYTKAFKITFDQSVSKQ